MVKAIPAVPAISVVMPLYNKAAQVLATVASVTAQTVSNWELVVVDDGSTDNGPALVRALADPRIRLVSQPNAGVSAARNLGIELASADLIAFLDADDLWLPEFLTTILALQTDYPEVSWFATGYEIRPPLGSAFASRLRGCATDFVRGILPDYFAVAICSDPPVWTSATAVQRSVIQEVGGFPVGIGSGEDLLTWARLAACFPLAYEARSLAVFVTSGIERKPDLADRVGMALAQLFRDHPNMTSLQNYLGLWYRMQAVMSLRFNNAAMARRQAFLAVRYGPLQLRNIYTLLLAILPTKYRQALDATLRRLSKFK